MRNAKVVAQYILSGISVVYCDYGVCQSTLSQKKKSQRQTSLKIYYSFAVSYDWNIGLVLRNLSKIKRIGKKMITY